MLCAGLNRYHTFRMIACYIIMLYAVLDASLLPLTSDPSRQLQELAEINVNRIPHAIFS